MVGYSALMGSDQQQAFDLLDKSRSIQKPLIHKYNGRWLKEMGDGVMACFNTVSDAVFCAVAIQTASKNEPHLKLRIGIHQGEVVFENNDVFGDGVNVAARIESTAPPGAIYVSSSVHQNISSQPELDTRFISEMELKNIGYPVKIYEVNLGKGAILPKSAHEKSNTLRWRKVAVPIGFTLLIAGIWFLMVYVFPDKQNDAGSIPRDVNTESELMALPRGPRIAVVPFTNLSNNPSQDYFTDGLTEDIITALTRSELFVLGSGTSFQLNPDTLDFNQSLESLEVSYLLKGSARRQQNNIRVNAQLIDVATNSQIWASNYDRDLTTTDLFSIQDDIAERVVSTISDSDGIIYRNNLASIVRKANNTIDAYECVLRSYRYAQSHTEEDHLTARKLLGGYH